MTLKLKPNPLPVFSSGHMSLVLAISVVGSHMVSWNEALPSRSRSRPLTWLHRIPGFGLDTSQRSRKSEPRGRLSRYKLQVPVRYALVITLLGAASMNAGLAAESAHVAKGNVEAAGAKIVGTKSDSGGANVGVPQAGSVGAGVKGGSAPGANDGAKETGAGSSAERGSKAPNDSGAHGGTNSDGTGSMSKTERGVGSTGANERGAQAPHNETGANPIDIRITVQSPTNLKTTTKAPDWTKIVGTSNSLRDRHQTSAPGLRIELNRNAIGVLAPREFTPSAVDGTARSAAGTALRNLPSVGRTGTGPLVSNLAPTVRTKTNAPTVNTATNPSVLNGSGIGHPGARPGMIGGAAKSVAGINGTSFRQKHP